MLWASAFVAIRHLGHDFSPGALSLGRLLVASLALTVIALASGLPRPTRREWASIVVIGVLWFGVYNVALNEGEQRVDAGTAAMLIQVAPVLIALLSAVFLDEPFTRNLAVGLALAFGGVVLIGTGSSPGGDRDVVGVALCLLAAATYAVSLVLQKPLMARLRSVHVIWLACTIGAVTCLPFAGQLWSETAAAPASSIWWLVYLGVFPTALAFSTYGYALRHMRPAGSASRPTWCRRSRSCWGWCCSTRCRPPIAYVGGALALVGVGVARRRPKPRAPRPAEESRPRAETRA